MSYTRKVEKDEATKAEKLAERLEEMRDTSISVAQTNVREWMQEHLGEGSEQLTLQVRRYQRSNPFTLGPSVEFHLVRNGKRTGVLLQHNIHIYEILSRPAGGEADMDYRVVTLKERAWGRPKKITLLQAAKILDH